jgi:putative ABC transport system permease protein
VRTGAWLFHEAMRDARHTIRLWSRRPWHTGFAILALAIGIGANTGVFSVVNALLLRSLPFHEPERLAYLRNFFPPHDSAAQFHEWRVASDYLADTALFETIEANLGGAGRPQRARAAQVSSNFFSLLGTQPVLGRAFVSGEDVDGVGWGTPGRNAVAVIGYGLWQAMFGGDPKALGKTVRTDGVPLTVIGVAPPGFDYPTKAVIWKPAAFSPGNNGWEAIARLKPGVTWAQARAAFDAEGERLWPNRTPAQRVEYPSQMLGLKDALAGPSKNASLVLMVSVAIILLIACANAANLLMARAADRRREFLIRFALGASRARLVQQLLTECILLAAVASAAGVLIALWTISIASNFQPAPLASQAYSMLDGRVLVFTVAASVVSGLLFGLLPSLYASRVRATAMREASDDLRARRVRHGLVAAQVALTVMLLTASISVGRALFDLMRVNRGFDPKGLVTVSVSLEGTTHRGGGRLSYFQEALARVRRLPGVQSASATEFLPLYTTDFIGGRFAMDGHEAQENSTIIPVLPDYLKTMRAQMVAGREFTDAEMREDSGLAVVSERFAREFGPAAAALGRQIASGRDSRLKIIGVVKGMDYMVSGDSFSQIFVPSHSPGGFFSTFVARVDGRPEDHLALVRDAIQSVDPAVPVFGAKTMEQRMADALARPRFYRTAVVSFTSFALILAIIGTYGMVSYAVARRSREMGIRLALGSPARRLRAKLMRQELTTVLVGAIPGIGGAIISGRVLESLVEGSKTVNARLYAGSFVFIVAVAAAAIWAATRPIARLNVADVLRSE